MGKSQQTIIRNDALLTLGIANEIKNKINITHISEVVLFTALAVTESSFFHEYLLRQGLTDVEISKKANILLRELTPTENKTVECMPISIKYLNKNNKENFRHFLSLLSTFVHRCFTVVNEHILNAGIFPKSF